MRLSTARVASLAAAAALSAVAAPAVQAAPRGPIVARDAFELALLEEINGFRAGHALAPVRASFELSAAAERQSHAMATYGFFAHESETGAPFWRRISAWYHQRGDRYWSVGQNLLWNRRKLSAKAALGKWLRSPSHRSVLLSPKWREVGLSAIHADGAPGFYRGRSVTILTANFGVRL